MKYFFLFILFLSFVDLFADTADITTLERRIQSHLIIQDIHGACQEAKYALKKYPEDPSLYKAAIEAWAQAGDEMQLLEVWEQYVTRFPDKKNDSSAIESMAWGIIKKGACGSSALTRIVAIMAAFTGQDAIGVKLVALGLRDNNAVVRGLSVQCVPKLRDAQLVDELMNIVKEDPDWRIRLEAMRALGQMKFIPAKELLKATLLDESRLAEERAIAVEALVNMTDSASSTEMRALIQSDRAGLRQLACEVAIHLELERDIDLMYYLLKDPHPDVRASALTAIGIIRPKFLDLEKVVTCLDDFESQVSLAAAWLITLYDDCRGPIVFRKLLNNPSIQIKVQASSALSATGNHALSLMEEIFLNSSEHYVKLNLVSGLIGQRRLMQESAHFLMNALTEKQERLCYQKEGIFASIVPLHSRKGSLGLTDPETENQLVRLEMISQLSLIDCEKALPALKHFLTTSRWGITGVAARLLLHEGDDSALEIIKELLNDDQKLVRVQAALALAEWGKDQQAIGVLTEAYPNVDRTTKQIIIDALGRIGDKKALSFLVERFKEPHQTLRLMAAASIIEVLNN